MPSAMSHVAEAAPISHNTSTSTCCYKPHSSLPLRQCFKATMPFRPRALTHTWKDPDLEAAIPTAAQGAPAVRKYTTGGDQICMARKGAQANACGQIPYLEAAIPTAAQGPCTTVREDGATRD
uniref:Uncharacterized protein n=1 Tax=Pyrodinium bahamense TaxID=73915 RepID=A0A7S0F8Y7_9DINO